MNYRDQIVARAARHYSEGQYGFKPTQGVIRRFINIREGVTKWGLSADANPFNSLDEAAAESLYDDYQGTVMINPDGTAVMLDLREHGKLLLEEAEKDERLEAAHEREVQSRWEYR